MNPVPLLLGGLALLLFASSRDKAKQNRFYAGVRAQLTGVELKGKNITVNVNFQNPNSKPATVRSAFGEVSLNGKKVGLVKMDKPVTVPANGEAEVSLNVQMKLANTITAVAELVKGVANSVIDITGTMNIDNSPIPMKLQYTIQPQ